MCIRDRHPGATIDPTVAIAVAKKIGDKINKGDVLGAIAHPSAKPYLNELNEMLTISSTPADPRPLIMGTVDQ